MGHGSLRSRTGLASLLRSRDRLTGGGASAHPTDESDLQGTDASRLRTTPNSLALTLGQKN